MIDSIIYHLLSVHRPENPGEGEKCIAGQDAKGQRVEGALGQRIYQFTDLAHFLTPFQYDEQLRFLMNGSLVLCHKQSLNHELLQSIREKNMFIFGSTRQKLLAFMNFLKMHRDGDQL